jgi:redox-sensitive bicupin YhaK (pirin superfamily)
MITLRRADERRHNRRGRREAWLTFSSRDRGDPLADGFGFLRMLNEDRVPPGAGLGQLDRRCEVVTYVREGALVYEDSTGCSRTIQAGEFRHVSTGEPGRHAQTNVSRTTWAHVFQICVRPSERAVESATEQKRFSAAERRGVLRLVASPDARLGSLRIGQDALVYSAMLDRGQHVIHELSEGRSAWLHVVQGDATLGDTVLTTGDGVGVTAERAVSLTARGGTEILLLDLGDMPRRSSRTGQRGDRTVFNGSGLSATHTRIPPGC